MATADELNNNPAEEDAALMPPPPIPSHPVQRMMTPKRVTTTDVVTVFVQHRYPL